MVRILKSASEHSGVPCFCTYFLKLDLDPIFDMFGLGCHKRLPVTSRVFPFFMILDEDYHDKSRTGR